ncbi:MAG: putative CRISPR-associated protein [Spirochaetota bacterium]
MKKNTIICTVGTSLLSHFRDRESGKITSSEDDIIIELKKLDEDNRKCGAEINSNHSIIKNQYIDEFRELYLCVSDTDEGQLVGKVLKKYYEYKYNVKVVVETVEHLENDYKKFKNHGLRNLVKIVSDIIYKLKNKDFEAVINATGGFKAQISFAGLIGQALQVPVYYQFELFADIIEMPPMPVSFDSQLWSDYFNLFDDFDKEGIIPEKDLKFGELDPRIQVLLDFDDGYYFLSPVGQLFYEGFKYRLRTSGNLPREAKEEERTGVNIKEREYPNLPKDTKPYLNKLYESFNFIKRIVVYYLNPDLPKKYSFRKDPKGEKGIIQGIYSDGKGATKFSIFTTAENEEELQKAIIILQDAKTFD